MRTLQNEFKAVHAEIRIFDPTLFEDTVVSKLMEDFNPILDGVRAYPILDGGGGAKKAPRVNSAI